MNNYKNQKGKKKQSWKFELKQDFRAYCKKKKQT